jgi:hypothetical protein
VSRVYAIRTRAGSTRFPVLVETTWSQILAGPYPEFDFKPVDYLTAHRWVRGGGQHETPLWWDGQRVRYAKDAK